MYLTNSSFSTVGYMNEDSSVKVGLSFKFEIVVKIYYNFDCAVVE